MANSVGVAEGGNQTIVGVGVAASVGTTVAVGRVAARGWQAIRSRSPDKRRKACNNLIVMTIFTKQFWQGVVKLPSKHSTATSVIQDFIVPDEDVNRMKHAWRTRRVY